MNTKNKVMAAVVMAALGGAVHGDELLSGPYRFDSVTSVHVKPAMLAGGWGMTLGGAWETVINQTVTSGFELDADIPVVPYPQDPEVPVQLFFGGLRLGALFGSDQILHGLFNNTVGVGLAAGQTFLIDEVTLGGEVNITREIRIFASGGYRYVYGFNPDRGLADSGLRGLVLDLGLRFGGIGS